MIRAVFLPLVLTLTVAASASAQVRKCTGTDGKVTYSDYICTARTVQESSVNTNANTIDASGLRKEANRQRLAEATEQALSSKSGRCRFPYFANGDSLGKTLSAAAKDECINNISAEVNGLPTQQNAYNRWSDHSGRKTASRQAATAQEANAANARNIAESNRNAINNVGSQLSNQINNKTYKCQPNLIGTAIDCR